MTESFIFYTLSLFLVGGSFGMIVNRHSVFASVSFMLAMIAMAGMFALLQQSFLFLAQILVAVGAVITLALLVIVSVNINPQYIPDEPNRKLWLLGTAAIVVPILLLMINAIAGSDLKFAELNDAFGSLHQVGTTLFAEYLLPFEQISIVLLVALVAGIIISRKRGEYDA